MAPYDRAAEEAGASWSEQVLGVPGARPDEGPVVAEGDVPVPSLSVGGDAGPPREGGAEGGGAPEPAGRGRVFLSCAGAGLALVALAAVLREGAGAVLPGGSLLASAPGDAAPLRIAGDDLGLADYALAFAAAGAVTGARQTLLRVWPAFREATDRSNALVLPNLSDLDLLWLSLLSGVPEEIFFRGSLLPAVASDWRGLAVSAVTFGYLHRSGGRNLAFAAWASAVGALYGGAFLASGKIAVPAMAHAAANLCAAVLWRRQQQQRAGAGAEQGLGE